MNTKLLLIVLTLSLSSCEEIAPACYECSRTVISSGVTTTTEICGEKQMKDWERANTNRTFIGRCRRL